jgi:hypothetical protein
MGNPSEAPNMAKQSHAALESSQLLEARLGQRARPSISTNSARIRRSISPAVAAG